MGRWRGIDDGLDREAEDPAERQDPGDVPNPVRQQRDRRHPAGEQQLNGDYQLERRGRSRRPERQEPSRPRGSKRLIAAIFIALA